jgi:hypothetical protein
VYQAQGNNAVLVNSPAELRQVAARFSNLAGGAPAYLLLMGDVAGVVAPTDLKPTVQNPHFALLALN